MGSRLEHSIRPLSQIVEIESSAEQSGRNDEQSDFQHRRQPLADEDHDRRRSRTGSQSPRAKDPGHTFDALENSTAHARLSQVMDALDSAIARTAVLVGTAICA